MRAVKHSTDDRIGSIATKYTSTGEHAKIPLTRSCYRVTSRAIGAIASSSTRCGALLSRNSRL
jgi:hypothetical protein